MNALPAHFWAKTAQTDCIVWQGAQNSKGYGCFLMDGQSQLAHRLAWERLDRGDRHEPRDRRGGRRSAPASATWRKAERGPIPDGFTIDHLCRVRACVNVAHMEVVSIAENNRRQPRRLAVGGECRNGHPIAHDDDLYYNARKGVRECRVCRLEQKRRSKAKSRVASP